MTLDSRQPWTIGKAAGDCVAGLQLAALGGCGGSGSNPIGNPPTVQNPPGASGQKLSFAYYQRCINPIFITPINTNGAVSTCAGSGCHDNVAGTGGALRIVPGAQTVDVTNPANTPDVIRASDMYKNFYSAQGSTLISSPEESRLINKPLVRGVLHGGGLIFTSDQDPNIRRIRYWITNPAPQGQDEFSPATYNMFTPADPNAGTCNTQ
jgi:hypothetical protein